LVYIYIQILSTTSHSLSSWCILHICILLQQALEIIQTLNCQDNVFMYIHSKATTSQVSFEGIVVFTGNCILMWRCAFVFNLSLCHYCRSHWSFMVSWIHLTDSGDNSKSVIPVDFFRCLLLVQNCHFTHVTQKNIFEKYVGVMSVCARVINWWAWVFNHMNNKCTRYVHTRLCEIRVTQSIFCGVL